MNIWWNFWLRFHRASIAIFLSRSHHHEIPGNDIRDIRSHDQQKTDENDNFVFDRTVSIIQLKLRSLKAFSTLVVAVLHAHDQYKLLAYHHCLFSERNGNRVGWIQHDLFLNLFWIYRRFVCFFFSSSDYFNEILEILNLFQNDRYALNCELKKKKKERENCSCSEKSC